MDVRHDDDDLARLEADPEYTAGLDRAIVFGFRKVMIVLRAVKHEGEIYNWPSLRFEKLSGKRQHQRSIRINAQWRLIVEIEQGKHGHCIVIKGIEDYH